MTTVTVHHNPFTPTRDFHKKIVPSGLSVRSLAPVTSKPFICMLNGKVLLRKDWDIKTRQTDVVNFVTLPQGGGGSNPMKIVALIAVMIIAAYLGPIVAGIMGFTNAGAVAAVTGAIGMIGSAIVNVLIPDKTNLSNSSYGTQESSPTYSISGQGNSARISEPIPVQYGKVRAYPDFAASPYVEYSGNEQYLYELFCVGMGEYEISTIQLEDTALDSFEEVETQIVNPGEQLTLFPASVETSSEVSGQEMLTNDTLGPFTANQAGTTANKISIDVVCSRGIYGIDSKGRYYSKSVTFKVEARAIDDYLEPVGDWITLGTETISGSTTTAQRRSYAYEVEPARYQVRVTRTDTKDTSSSVGHEVDWTGLKAYLEDEGNVYEGMTLLAVKMRATNNISSTNSRKINVICTRKLPKWNPDAGWSDPVVTQSIAWAFADCCRATYSAKLEDDKIDLQALYDLDKIWTERGDQFNYRFDSKTTVWDALQTIAKAGRAKPFKQGGMVRIIRDGHVDVPVGMFTMNNIVKDSFNLQYLMPTDETADAVEIEYYDERIWTWKTVTCALPDSVAEEPYSVKLLGVTSRDQAYREGMYMAACNRYRRRMISFTTEMEGFIPTMGDLVIVSHDMPQWGQSSLVRSYDTETGTITVSEPLEWKDGSEHFVALRRPNGEPWGKAKVAKGATDYEAIFTDEKPDFELSFGQTKEATYCTFGWGETWSQPARVLSVKPKDEHSVEISLVGEDDTVHEADTSTIPKEVVHSQLPGKDVQPQLTGLIVRSQPGNTSVAILSWNPSPWADSYDIEQSTDLNTWTRTGETTATNFSCTAIYGNATYFRVRAVGLMRGNWEMIAYATGADYMWSADEDTLMWNEDETTPMWKY